MKEASYRGVMFQDEIGFGREIADDCRVAAPLAHRLRDSRASVSLRWLERIAARVSVSENEVFPTQELLDNMPLLIEAIADYLENPVEEGAAAERVIAKAAELGELRFGQGFSPYEILKEFEVLGGIVLSYLARVSDELNLDCPPGEFLICAQRIHRSLALIQQATAARYLAMVETRANEREQRLRAVSELLGGPLRHRLDETISTALDLTVTDPEAFVRDLRNQLDALRGSLDQVQMLSTVIPSSRMHRNVPLAAAIAEAIRNMRDNARQRGVEIRVGEPIPDIEVNAGAIELAVLVFLTTLLRNATQAGATRTIEVTALGGDSADDAVVQVSVRDIGAMIAEDRLRELVVPELDGTVTERTAAGVSLAVAREAIEALGGRISLHVDPATPALEFVLELPSRRFDDVA